MNREFGIPRTREKVHQPRDNKSRLYKVDSSERISHDDMSWDREEIDFVAQKVASSPEDSCSSTSGSSALSSSSSTEFHGWKAYSSDEEKWQRIIRSKWGGYGLHLRLWEDSNAPLTKVRKRDDLVLDHSEYCGVLSDRMIGACSSFLTVSPENGRYVLSKCDLNKLKLTDLSVLRHHRYIQYLDLSYNFLIDLQPLGDIPYLVYLNASHNKLKDVLKFAPPWYLTYVNLSHNDITVMTDLSEFWSIVRLDLSHNAIETICGLQNLRYLRYLNLSYNLIESVSNLDNLYNIQELNLEYNYITSFKSADPESGINTLPNLRTLIMGHNRLSTLEFFRGAYGLRLIDLKYNKIADLLEVSNMRSLVYEVDLRGNPCTKWPNYRDVLIFSMPSVKFVDGGEVTVAEKVSAATVYAPPVELLAARNISKLVLLEQLNPPKIDASVAPYDRSSPPLVILSGPSAVKKVALGLRIAEKLTNRVRYCRSHTTRDVDDDEDEGKAYYSVKRDEFNDMARRGEFLSIEELLGNSYGFHTSEIAALRNDNKIGITQMDLSATMQMRNRYPNVKLVLVLTKDEEVHRKWIEEKFHIFTWIKDSIENLLAVKIGKKITAESPESSHSRIAFISELVNEVIDSLELPTYSMYLRPQGTGATTTDIIMESRTFLPKSTKRRSQLEMEERKHITFRTENFGGVSDGIREIVEENPKPSDLRVIMDEHANIIVDDEESKRKRKRARVLFRHSVLKLRGSGVIDDEEFTDSLSSGQSLEKFPQKRVIDIEYLKNTYIDTILKSRNMYIDQHQTKPGFYSLVLFTDDFEKASNSLLDFMYELHLNQPFRKPTRPPEIDYLHRSVIPDKVRAIVEELRESTSTAKIQKKTLLRTYGTTSWKDPMPSQTVHRQRDLINEIEKELKKRSHAECSAPEK